MCACYACKLFLVPVPGQYTCPRITSVILPCDAARMCVLRSNYRDRAFLRKWHHRPCLQNASITRPALFPVLRCFPACKTFRIVIFACKTFRIVIFAFKTFRIVSRITRKLASFAASHAVPYTHEEGEVVFFWTQVVPKRTFCRKRKC